MEVFLMILSLVLLFALMRPVTTVLHELGHAIPALLFTAGSVSMVIGVPKRLPEQPLLRIARLKLWITKDPLKWLGGYCSHEAAPQRWQRAVILVGGVAFSLAIATTVAYWAFKVDLHGFIRTILLLLAISTIVDLFINLIPSRYPIRMPDGRITFNDGAQFRWLFSKDPLMAQWKLAVEHSSAQRYETAWAMYKHFLGLGWKDPAVFENGLTALVVLRRNDEALALYEQWCLEHTPTANGLALGGLVLSRTKRYEAALVEFDKALELDPDRSMPVNNKGYTLNKIGRYQEAIACFNRVLALGTERAYPLNNRGLARIKLGDRSGGLADIEEGLRIDPANAYGYRNLGIHHLDEGRADEALKLLLKAKTLNPETDMVDELIAQARSTPARTGK